MVEDKLSDLDLIKRFRKGSIDAFEELITRHEAKIYNLAMRFTRNVEDAEEVLQDVFATLYRKIDGFEGKSQFSSWLYRIIVNAAFMKLRKRKQENTVSIEDLSPSVRQLCVDRDPLASTRSDTISMNRELRDVMQTAIQKLPEQYRAVFVLRDVDGLSNQEVGEILDLSIPAVKSRLHRSRLMLRKRLRAYHDEYLGLKPRVRRTRGRQSEAMAANM
jgi:RNA polymerase sigma-70 factor, ECF subfamily